MSKRRRRRNPNQFTTDEIRTATLLVTEGTTGAPKRNAQDEQEYKPTKENPLG